MNSNKCMICGSNFSLKKLDEMCIDTNGKPRNALAMFKYCFNLKFPRKNSHNNFNQVCDICFTELSICCVFRRKSEQAYKKLNALIVNKVTDHKKISSEISTKKELQIFSNIYEIPLENIKIEEIDKEDINYLDEMSSQFNIVSANQVKNKRHSTKPSTKLENKYNKHSDRTLSSSDKIVDIMQQKVKKKSSGNVVSTDTNIMDDDNFGDSVEDELNWNNLNEEENFSDCSTKTEEILVATGYYSEMKRRRNRPKYDDSRPPLKKDCLCCPICNESFLHFNLTHQHYIKHFPRNLCHICGKTTTTQSGFVTHMRTHAQEEPNKYVCTPCNKVFKTQYIQRSHMKFCHNGYKSATCYHCPQQFTGSLSRVIHMHKVHNIPCEFYYCGNCPMKFYGKSQLKSHMNRIHIRKLDFYCDACGCGFIAKKELREHIVFKHGDKSTHPKCEICGRTFATNKGLKEHMKIHLNIKNYKCPYCESAFVQKPSLNCHLKKYHRSEESSNLFQV